jgi:3-hydroxyisobutyrate dehydrogenase-like beta-hydroxyacid dehydrogenase
VVGFLGLGIMGQAMARNLLTSGKSLVIGLYKCWHQVCWLVSLLGQWW